MMSMKLWLLSIFLVSMIKSIPGQINIFHGFFLQLLSLVFQENRPGIGKG